MHYDASGLPEPLLCQHSEAMKRSLEPRRDPWILTPSLKDERRSQLERRHRIWWSVLYGSFNPRRRRSPRRLDESRFHSLDWHGAHLLAVSIGILILSVADAFMTVTLLSRGAVEMNPIMALLVQSDVGAFASLKMAMTGCSVVLMVCLARYRFMRVVRVELVLYSVLVVYAILIGYEIRMLQKLFILPFF
jgi:hypothetical protein